MNRMAYTFGMVVVLVLPSLTQAQYGTVPKYPPTAQYPLAGQNPTAGSTHAAAAARMRPIESPSAVDRFRATNRNTQASNSRYQETAFRDRGDVRNASWNQRYDTRVRQVAMMQQEQLAAPALNELGLPPGTVPGNTTIAPGALPGLPGGSMGSAPPIPVPDPTASAPPRSLPQNPPALPIDRSAGVSSPSDLRGADLRPMAQPQLNNHGFATVDNCNCVSPPSGYTAASGIGCGSGLGNGYVSPASCNTPAYGYTGQGPLPTQLPAQLPAQIAAPAVMPGQPVLSSGLGLGVGNGAPPRALVSLGQQLNTVQVGQGLWGQPVAYVTGQSIRNWIRYFFP